QELCWLKQIEMAESVIQYVACMTQSRGGDGLHPKPPTEVDLKAQRIQSERARLLTSKSNREA
ncbi:hypothetical protein JZU57_00635, partial [bacterium]|nr:hypothetical protein [bacterium]